MCCINSDQVLKTKASSDEAVENVPRLSREANRREGAPSIAGSDGGDRENK